MHPDHRQRGLGGMLLAAIEAAFPDVTDYEPFTGERSERNLRFYVRRGYVQVDRQVVSPRLALIFFRKRHG